MTFVAVNPRHGDHDLPGHPEGADRVDAIVAHLDQTEREWPRLVPDREASASELAIHTPRLLHALEASAISGPVNLDPDTYLGPRSRIVALETARLGIQAVDRCIKEEEPGLVLARPPGHHATADRSMGFCLLNNVAIAAQHALHAGLAKRVLILDHDVHHGNGTQDLFYSRNDVLYQSFHLGAHYPGTGDVDEIGTGQGRGYTNNVPLPLGSGEVEVTSAFTDLFLPIARAFHPDLVLVSAGYDSLRGDPLGGLTLDVPFFGVMAGVLRKVSPRVVAFLEGGYQRQFLGPAAESTLDGFERPLAMEPPKAPAAVVVAARKALASYWPVLAR